jgi:eukaryotic-like serine/threonine-protein kinase
MKCESCGHSNLDGARFCASCGALLPADQKGPDPMIGQLIGGRFRVTGVLGEGGMGIVYVGEQQMGSTVRKVAIKTLHAHLSKDPSVLARFHRECGTVAQLEHPNTIKVYDFGATQDGTLYIAMEFVAGRPLADVIREGALAPERVIKILRQACGALDEAHETGIIHRDLKPENVILTNRAGETDFVKLLDFGIAARSESADAQKEQKLTQQGMVLGTPPYMSPEQFTGKALDARSDIYSLGVMAYEMLTGRLPFEADTPWQWATQHMTAQPTPFETAAPSKSIPSGMRQAILRSLSKEREQRQNSAREFFAEVSDGSRITVEAPPPPGAAHVKTGTAAMEQAPDFSAAGVPMSPAHGGTMPGGTPMGGMAMPAPARPPIPPGPTGGRGKQGGGKGLIVGLGALGAFLLVAMAVVAARSLKQDEDEPLASPLGSTSGNDPVAIEPSETTPTSTSVNVAGAAAVPTSTPAPEPPPKQAGGTKPSTPSTGSNPSTPNTGSTPTPNTGSTPTKPPPSGGGACDSCRSLAESGSIAGAVSAANACSDSSKKAVCVSKIRTAAANAAKSAARNGNCPGARQIVAMAAQVGASIGGALKGTSCE